MRHAIRHRFAFVRIRCDARDVRRMAYAQANPIPAQSVSHDRWLGEDARGKTWGQTSQLSLDREGNVGG